MLSSQQEKLRQKYNLALLLLTLFFLLLTPIFIDPFIRPLPSYFLICTKPSPPLHTMAITLPVFLTYPSPLALSYNTFHYNMMFQLCFLLYKIKELHLIIFK